MKNKYIKACDYLKKGSVIAYPTESVFGLGADPFNQQAVEKLLQLKQRSATNGLILISHNFADLSPFVDQINPITNAEKKLLYTKKNNNYTHTWLIPFGERCPSYLYGEFNTLAIRITQHPVAAKICSYFGPIISTSANPHTSKPAYTKKQVINYFGNDIHIIDGNLGKLEKPTKIVDLKSLKIIRN